MSDARPRVALTHKGRSLLVLAYRNARNDLQECE